MRKYLMVAAVVAMAACGEKKAETPATDAAAGAAAEATVDTMVQKADSTIGAMADSVQAAAPAGAMKAAADTVTNKMEAKPAPAPTH